VELGRPGAAQGLRARARREDALVAGGKLRSAGARDVRAERNRGVVEHLAVRVGDSQRERSRTESLRRYEIVVVGACERLVAASGPRLELGDRVAVVADLERDPVRAR